MEKETDKSKELEEFLTTDTDKNAMQKVNERCIAEDSMRYLEDLLDKATDENMLRIVNEKILTPKEKEKEYQEAYRQMSCDLRFLKTVVEGEYVNTMEDLTGSHKAYCDYDEKIKNYLDRLKGSDRENSLVKEIIKTAEENIEAQKGREANEIDKL